MATLTHVDLAKLNAALGNLERQVGSLRADPERTVYTRDDKRERESHEIALCP